MRIGLDPQRASDISSRLLARAGELVEIQNVLSALANHAFNPLQYVFEPGSLLIAPGSIYTTQHAMRLANDAAADLQELVRELETEIKSQQTVSVAKRTSHRRVTPKRAPKVLPIGADPQTVTDWWLRLSPSDQITMIKHKPDLIGNFDGIPATARDEANRLLIKQLIAKENIAAETKDELLLIMRDLESTEARHPDTLVQLLMVDHDTDDTVQTAIAIGNADDASHLATFSFGIHTSIKSLPKNLSGASEQYADMKRLLRRTGENKTPAVIIWQGYDSGTVITVHRDAKAKDGAESFVSFSQGLTATNPTAIRTDIAHSYGTRMLTEALRSGATSDSAVLLGSPGTSRDMPNSSELAVPQGNIYAARAKQDHVASTIYRATSGPHWPERMTVPVASPDPVSESWGAKQLNVKTSVFSGLGHNFYSQDGGGYQNDAIFVRQISHIILGRN